MSTLDPTALRLKSFDSSFVGAEFKLKVHHQVKEWSSKTLAKADVLLHCLHTVTANTDDDSASAAKELKIDADLDKLTDEVLTEIVTTQQFTAKEGTSSARRVGRDTHYRHAALLGLGATAASRTSVDCETSCFVYKPNSNDSTTITSAAATRAGKASAACCKALKAATLCVTMKAVGFNDKSLVAFIEGLLLGSMVDDRYTSKKPTDTPKTELQQVDIYLCCATSLVKSPQALCRLAQHNAYGIDVARQLTTAPANYCNPETLADCATKLAAMDGLDIKLLKMKELENRKMGAFVAVGKGSATLPCLIHMTYTGEPVDGKPLRKLAFIGKGVTMDTGGYNIKTMMMELMKFDMGGSAAVIGAACAVGRSKPKGVQVHFIVGAAENMISANAFRPSDVLTASNGTTIEIGNTDAEGRLVLCDCLVYAQELKVDFMMDLATLTGAGMVGLGREIGHLYGTDSALTSIMLNGAHSRGENLWPMPLYTPYRADMDSRIADVNNCAAHRYGGSIHAALFLKDFVKSVPWCHIDLAGPAWCYKESIGTGFGVRAITEFCYLASEGVWHM